MPRITGLNFLYRLLDLVHLPERNIPNTKEGMIRKAVGEMRLVELVYDGYSRIVEIHVYGKKNGKDGIMVYQIRGKSSTGKLGWKRMHLEKIVHLRVLREKFPGRRMTSDRHSSWDDTYFTVDE